MHHSIGKRAKKFHPFPKEPSNLHSNGNGSANGHALVQDPATAARSPLLPEKIKELLRLAQEQGYLTYSDINDALPDSIVNPEDLDEIYIKLRGLEVEIV